MSKAVPASFVRALERVDAASKDALTDYVACLEGDAATLRHLLACARQDALARASTWALKALAEDGAVFGTQHRRALVRCLTELDDDWVVLHLLQTVSLVGLDARDVDALEARVEELLEREHKFVRAWSYDALAQIARVAPARRAACEERLRAALEDEAASVRARIRAALRAL